MSNAPYFVDLSSNNGASAFDAEAYAAAGHVLVAVKVTQGAKYVNPEWREWAQQAHEHHVSVVYYHFADNTATAAAQAAHFAATLKGGGVYRPGVDGICLDVEQGSLLASPVVFRQQFEVAVKGAGYRNLVVYSDAGYFEQFGDGLRPVGGRLWVAAYPKLPSGWWGEPWAHQYTQTGRVEGVTGPVDVSVLSPAAAEWHAQHRP